MTSLVTMTTTPAKETLFHVLSNGLCEMFLAGSIDFIYFFLDFLTFFYKEPVLNVPEYMLILKLSLKIYPAANLIMTNRLLNHIKNIQIVGLVIN